MLCKSEFCFGTCIYGSVWQRVYIREQAQTLGIEVKIVINYDN